MRSSRVSEQQHADVEQPPREQPRQPADEDLSAELARIEERYKRALADLDNYRKRAGREVERRVDEAGDALLRDWFDVVDSLERALRAHPDGPLADGLRAVLEQIEAILARRGVARIGAVGEPFDPERHEAIDVRPTDEVEDRTVVEVARSGFAVRDRVLRPAQVVVSRRPDHDT
ncbi:MAG: molecular chaperone GrpE [Solirubrobacteraceae bacterium]